LNELAAEGKTVFVMNDVPNFPFPAQSCQFQATPLSPSQCSMDVSSPASSRIDVDQELQELGTIAPGVRLMDSYSFFCDELTCNMTQGDELLYWDQDHLNARGSRFVVERLVETNPDFASALQ
jgi:hypothetical protein